MKSALTGSCLGAGIYVVAMQVPAVVVATQLPRDVARQAFLGFWEGALVQYAVVGGLAGLIAGLLLSRLGEPFERRWIRFLLPHALLTPLVGISAALGDRDPMNWLLVGGVASALSLVLLLPRKRATAVCWILALVLSATPWVVLRSSSPVERPALVEPADGSLPDLALVVLDTVRRDRLALYGDLDGGTLVTPALEALARTGVRFDAAHSASPWSAPSHATLFTGKVPSRHGTTQDTLHLGDDQLTLAEHLRRRGYLTAGFSGNPWVSDATGLTRGFHAWVERGGEAGIASHFLLAKILDAGPLSGERDKGGRAIVEALGDFLEPEGPPRFVFVNLSEPHAPYWRIPARARRAHDANDTGAQRASLRALEAQHHGIPLDPSASGDVLRSYDAAIAYADELLGGVVDALDATGREVCLLVLADHGEMFGEHGVWGHGHGLYRPALQVPMVLHCPSLVEGGRTFTPTASLADVAPTLVDLAGLDPGPLAEDGVSLLPWLQGTGDGIPHEHGVFAEHEVPEYLVKALDLQGHDDAAARLRVRRRTVISGPWRYEQAWPEGGDVVEHLFHLGDDPREERDLADEAAAASDLALARARMRGWEDRSVGPWQERGPSLPADLPPDTEMRLRALGYLD